LLSFPLQALYQIAQHENLYLFPDSSRSFFGVALTRNNLLKGKRRAPGTLVRLQVQNLYRLAQNAMDEETIDNLTVMMKDME
jgi:hypothetical protein